MRQVTAPLFITTLLLVVAIIGLACGGGEEATPPPTSEATRTASPPSTTPEPTLTPTAQEVDETLAHYENTELGFAFNYPDQWQITEEGAFEIAVAEPEETVATIIVGDPRSEQLHGMLVQVNVNKLETEREISEAILGLDDLFAQAFAQVAGAEVRETDSAVLAGMPARRFVIDFEYGGTVPSTSEQLIAPTPGLTFQLFCEAPRELFAEIRIGCQMVLDSFEFTTGQ